MGTRSLTVVKETLKAKDTIVLYRQFDGYPTGHGAELKAFLEPLKLVNGLGRDSRNVANGMSCLAAQLVMHFKGNQNKDNPLRQADDIAGGFYLYPSGTRDAGEEFIYTLYEVKGTIYLMLQGGAVTYFGMPGTKQSRMPVLYQGPITDFDPDREEGGYRKLQRDIPNDFLEDKKIAKKKRTKKIVA